MIISYIVFYVLLSEKQYYKKETTLGVGVIKPVGTLVGTD